MTELGFGDVLDDNMACVDVAEGAFLDGGKVEVGTRGNVDEVLDGGGAAEGIEEVEGHHELGVASEAEEDCVDGMVGADLLDEVGVGDVALHYVHAGCVMVGGEFGGEALGVACWEDEGWLAWVL